MSARDRILARVRRAVEARDPTPAPEAFGGWRPEAERPTTPVDDFTRRFLATGGEVQRVSDEAAARAWIQRVADAGAGVALGAGVPDALTPDAALMSPADAPLGVSMARGAVGETGSLLLDARDGRRTQLLPPVHVVVVDAATVRATLAEALADVAADPPSALGLHSGPSKSADIGKVMVTGVHGPGRVVALLVG